MLKNHIKIAWRSLKRHSIYAVINLTGLIVGIAAALLIYRILVFELSFNKQFQNYDRIGRVVNVLSTPEGTSYGTCTPEPAMNIIEEEIVQFEMVARVKEMWGAITVPNPAGGPPLKKFNPDNQTTAFFAESEFLEIFSFNWLAGDRTKALEGPGGIVLTKTWAEKCFGDWKNAVDQPLMLENITPLVVRGVVADPPSNCDFNFPYLVSYGTLVSNPDQYFYNEGWGSCSSNDQLFAKLLQPDLVEDANKALALVGKEEYADRDRNRLKKHIYQPIADLHFSEHFANSGSHRTKRSRLYLLGAIGIVIILMACFNFINLSTAQSVLRSKEVGVRKTLGSTGGQVAIQFLLETGLLVMAAIVSGTLLASFALPLLPKVSNLPNDIPLIEGISVPLFLVLLMIATTVLAGLYPALALARFKPIDALQNSDVSNASKGLSLRRALVILQFAIAQALIIAAVINILQLNHVRNQDLGFSEDLLYTFSFNNDSLSQTKHQVLKQRLKQLPKVRQVSLSSDQPLSGNTWSTNMRYDTRPEDEPWHINLKFCDADYSQAYDIQMMAGTWYEDSDTMKQGVVNAEVIRKLGLSDPHKILGKAIRIGGREIEIVGVTSNFHTHSARSELQPLLLTTRKKFYWEAGVKINSGQIAATIHDIKKVFDQVFPEQVFEGQFLDEQISMFYENDQRLAATTKGFGFLAIFISCLGLFGLATHAATQRVKEIGIRKVLGATVGHILYLLSKDFLLLIIVALLIATPLAAYLMSRWLENFVFRISMPWWVFGVTGIGALTLALLTVGIQAYRAASISPVHALKDE